MIEARKQWYWMGVTILAVPVFLILALLGSPGGDSIMGSQVIVESDELQKEIPEGKSVGFVISFTNRDPEYKRTIELGYNFTGSAENWMVLWSDEHNEPINEGTLFTIVSGETLRFNLYVNAPVNSSGDTKFVWIFAHEGPPVAASRNSTMLPDDTPLILRVDSVKAYQFLFDIDSISMRGNDLIYQEQSTDFAYQLKSSGALSDDFELEVIGGNLSAEYVSFVPASGRINGTYDGLEIDDLLVEGHMTIVPDRGLMPGIYSLEIAAFFNQSGLVVRTSEPIILTVPEPELRIVPGSFRILNESNIKVGAPVIVEIKVVNEGGNVDLDGKFVEEIQLTLEGSGFETQLYFLDSMPYGEEITIQFVITPQRTGDLEMEITLDSSEDVRESNEDTNSMSESIEVPSSVKEDGGLIPASGLIATSAALLSAAFWRRR